MTTTPHDGSRWRFVREALGLSQREMAERLNSLDPEGLKVAATSVSRYERGQFVPAPHIQGAYQAVALLGGVPIPEQSGPRLHVDQVVGMLEAETIIAYCIGVIDGVEHDPPPNELAEAIRALARSSLATAQRQTAP